MTTYQRMAALLKSTGVYLMDGSTLIDAEMAAYGKALDGLLAETEKLAQAIFFDYPENPYASRFEQLFGLPVTPATIEGVDMEERRAKIEAMKKRIAIGNRSFHRAGIEAALESFGLTATLFESREALVITLLGNLNYLATAEEVEEMLHELFPCGVHLTLVWAL